MLLLNQDGIVKETMGNAALVKRYLREGGAVGKRLALPVVVTFLSVAVARYAHDGSFRTGLAVALGLVCLGLAVGLARVTLAG